MERASEVTEAFVNALSGMAFAPVEAEVVFGVVPAVVPPLAEDEPWVLVVPASTVAGAESAAEPAVYFTEEVSALEPADAEADAENDVVAPAPLAPEDAPL